MKELKTQISSLKRSITRRINLLDVDLKSEERISRTALRRKVEALEKIMKELEVVITEAMRLEDWSDEERIHMEDLLGEEENRVVNKVGQVQDHLEARADETETLFGSDQRDLRHDQVRRRGEMHSNPENTGAPQTKHAHQNQTNPSKIEGVDSTVPRWLQDSATSPDEDGWIEGLALDTGHSHKEHSSTYHTPLKVTPKEFSGDPCEWKEFITMFHALIHQTSRSPQEKLWLLKLSLKGEPSPQEYYGGTRYVLQGIDIAEESVRGLKSAESSSPIQASRD